ncbi:hypothetical protein WH47_00281 [Habropoda laboriosa]|uniref:Uncharacterized protein n=1 Tax=Habropoda laboriosa TaxID=597456 RepID=A0A0L7R1R4_9HYME|nr:hypothetical protein WH47_00281 [Habropoda laboriosa]
MRDFGGEVVAWTLSPRKKKRAGTRVYHKLSPFPGKSNEGAPTVFWSNAG